MFKFLKDKLKGAISKISEGVEKEGKVEEKIVEKTVEKGFFAKIKDKFAGKEVVEESKPEIKEEKDIEEKTPVQEEKIEKKHETEKKSKKEKIRPIEKKPEEKLEHKKEHKHEPKIEVKEEPEKKGFFQTIKEKIVTTKINQQQFEKLFWEMELVLMENNVAVEVIGKIKNDLKEELVEKPIRRTKVEVTILSTLKSSIEELFESNDLDLINEIKNKREKPYIITFFGINGSGKTTSIAKLANLLNEKKISCVLAAADTFRAASIEQLQLHADKLGVKIIKHGYGSDPAAVAFDAIKHAQAKNVDVVLIDTAGRMHSNENLISEMKKIIRVAKPDLKIFVGESITGNDCVEQAKTFNDAVGIDGIILAKADVDEKGGAAVSVSYVTKKPILYLGMGQEYKDLEPFNSEVIMKNLGLA
ncbi:signal recognition particle-docking protein FtsY [Candidatus Woesearchaeota archaeon]|jgi:fused signal recognition particle receptor|nr:signal recognition particle-docking protein FtsY [Candidatus Woesearchaeota archaeon]|tara:strand:- start:11279 stop:12529 length:1251 start_codon:yes stop_codon:yes gene_type:complete